MKKLSAALLTATMAVGALTGCQTTLTPNQSEGAVQALDSTTLQSYNWQLIDATRSDGSKVTPLFYDVAKPLVLTFFKQGNSDRVGFINTCNNMSASYNIQNGDVQLVNPISTMMACPEPEASFDRAAMTTVQGKYSISQRANQAPILTIKSADQVAHFKAVAKQ